MFSEEYGRQTALGSAKKALDPNLTDDELAGMARSDEVKIRAVVAERTQTPLTSLLQLANDPAPAVRAGVARNPRTDIPIDVRDSLAQDKNPEVLHALIRCEAVPPEILSRLGRSWNRDVAAAAKVRAKSLKTVPPLAVGSVGLASS